MSVLTKSFKIETGDQETSQSQNFFYPLLLVITLVAAVLRLYALDLYPQRFNQDEMVMGYDAWSIWLTGRDQHGQFLPIHFQTFNDYVPPVGNYITAPFVGILGLNEFTTRLPYALFGIATVWLVGLLGRRWFGVIAGLVAAGLMATDPWHLNYSRIAFPASLVPFFTVLSLYCFTQALTLIRSVAESEQSPKRSVYGWLIAAGVSFALLTSAYPPLKMEAPMLFGACILAALPVFWKRKRLGLVLIAAYALVVSPVAINQLQNWSTTQTRYSNISVFLAKNWPTELLFQYASHYNPRFLFFDGFKEGVGIRPDGVGELFWLEGLLWLLAFAGFIIFSRELNRKVGFHLPLVLVIWFLTFPIAASLTVGQPPYEIRAYNFLPLPQLLSGFGVVVAGRVLAKYQWGKLKAFWIAASVAVALFVVFQVIFLSYFFGPSLLQTSTAPKDLPYNVGMSRVVVAVQQQATACDTIYLQPDNQAYIYYLFLSKYPPEKFQHAKIISEVNRTGWLIMDSFDNVQIGVPGEDKSNYTPPASCTPDKQRLFFLDHTIPVGPEWQEIASVKNKDGEYVWRAVVKAS
ncbi:MAG TPA: glycosyltransferase family 39 protein [Chloroflexia bacterium]|nr:glycosyltransferase family 39 protein [Chloroflexia bacterium]